jgi:hypothetical protein
MRLQPPTGPNIPGIVPEGDWQVIWMAGSTSGFSPCWLDWILTGLLRFALFDIELLRGQLKLLMAVLYLPCTEQWVN